MKKVLLISQHFYPSNIIGAIRPTKIAQKLRQQGYQVDVFTRYQVSPSEIERLGLCDHLFALEDYVPEKGKRAAKKRGRLYQALYHAYLNVLSLKEGKRFLKKFQSMLQEDGVLGETEYDIVLSSFGPMSSLMCGMYYKKIKPQVRWLCDFRDPVDSKFIEPIIRPIFSWYQARACKRADAIIAVSRGYLERICRGKYKEKAFMIPNGYDLEDAACACEAKAPEEFLRMSYVGTLYSGSRDLSPVFQALSASIQEGKIDAAKLRVSYAGNNFHIILEQAKKYALEQLLEDHGSLSREACLELQYSSHLLLLATWNDKKEYGVFPGKLLEYMLIGKPIISVTSGERPDGEVSCVIREGRLGVAYEEARSAQDAAELKEALEAYYQQWQAGGQLHFEPEQAVLERYSYRTVIAQIEAVISNQ